MSFGYGVGDILSLEQLAWKAYRSCKDAPESFKNISQEVLSLHALLKEIQENLSTETLSSTRQARLKIIGDGCHDVLEELQSLVDNTTQIVIENKLDKYLWELQNGKREGSVITTQTADSLSTDEKKAWRAIRKELEDVGITVAAFDANRDFIMNWFKAAVDTGAFDQPLEDASSSQICESGSGQLREDTQHKTAVTGLSTGAKTLHMQIPQKASTGKKLAPRLAVLIGWALRYDKELANAASQGQTAATQVLLEKGANANSKGKYGWTALHCAAYNGCEAVVQLLLEKGADANAKSKYGWTALHWATYKGHETVVQLLLKKGANANAKDNDRRTALEYAAGKEHGYPR
ncbi:MAG: hypothetical protein M1839_006536 [Geoglossum umbratile]|nr:MAG: hypothetical protein M1839_006536 [Geoglossum umbratile]